MLILMLAALAVQDAPKTINHKVEIDGKTYRVEIKGRTVEVYDKSIITVRTPERGDKLRRAVIKATGCPLKEEYWAAAHLRGLLDCGAAGNAPMPAPTPPTSN